MKSLAVIVGLPVLLVLVAPLNGVAQPVQCVDCDLEMCEELNEHTSSLFPYASYALPSHSNCAWAIWGCYDSHGPCRPTEDSDLRALLRVAAHADVDGLREVLSRFDDRVVVNLERGSVQLASCNGQGVIANVPLPREAVVALTQE